MQLPLIYHDRFQNICVPFTTPDKNFSYDTYNLKQTLLSWLQNFIKKKKKKVNTTSQFS